MLIWEPLIIHQKLVFCVHSIHLRVLEKYNYLAYIIEIVTSFVEQDCCSPTEAFVSFAHESVKYAGCLGTGRKRVSFASIE